MAVTFHISDGIKIATKALAISSERGACQILRSVLDARYNRANCMIALELQSLVQAMIKDWQGA